MVGNIDVVDDRLSKRFYSKKYGIGVVRFTHRSQNVLHTSTKLDDHAVRYHSLHGNTYLSYFRGHTARCVFLLEVVILMHRVRSVQMNPTDDTFLSAGDDGTVRLWDLRSPSCKVRLTLRIENDDRAY